MQKESPGYTTISTRVASHEDRIFQLEKDWKKFQLAVLNMLSAMTVADPNPDDDDGPEAARGPIYGPAVFGDERDIPQRDYRHPADVPRMNINY